jgi:hypothetical protein
MRKYGLLMLVCLMISGCNQRKTGAETHQEEVTVIEEDGPSPKTVTNNANARPNSYDQAENIYTLNTPDITELLSLPDVESLRINTNVNPINDYRFLTQLSRLKELHIYGFGIDKDENFDIGVIRNMRSLERLWLQTESITVDCALFSRLTNLQRLDLNGRYIVNSEALFALPRLEYLFLSFYYDSITLENAAPGSNVELLHIFAHSVNLENIKNLPRLRTMRLHTGRIVNLWALDNPAMETLTLESFDSLATSSDTLHIDSIARLEQLKSLQVIHFNITDVSPLLSLPHLENVLFLYNTVDIMPLADHKRIQQIFIDSNQYNAVNREPFENNGITVINNNAY